MATLKPAKTPQQVKRLGLASARESYNELADSYNKLLNYEYIACPKCGNFAKTDTAFYQDARFVIGRFPICKKCVMEMVEQRETDKDKPNETKESVQRMLKLMDLPYIDNLYEKCKKDVFDAAKEKNISSPFAAYNKILRSLPNYKGMTWKNSEFGADEAGMVQDERKARDEIVKLFGSGFSDQDYLYLQDQYDDLCARTQVDSKSQQIYAIQICMQLLDIYKDRKAGRDVTKKLSSLDTLMNAANLQPKQNVSNAATDSLTFGQLIEKWEEEKPIPEPAPEFKDVDGIGKYIRVWFTGWLCKALGLKANVFTKEFDEEIKKYTVTKPELAEFGSNEDIYNRLFGTEGGETNV